MTTLKPEIVYVYLRGRIGNILFQLAAGASLAKELNAKIIAIPARYNVVEPDNCSILEYIQQFNQTLLRKIMVQVDFPTNCIVYNEPFFHYMPIVYAPSREYRSTNEPLPDFILRGYFQSEKYFDKSLVFDLFLHKNIWW